MATIKTIIRTIKHKPIGMFCLLLMALLPANLWAASIDRPFFRASSMVIVIAASDFAENGGTAPIVSDFYLLDNTPSGQSAPDIIAGDGVGLAYSFPPPGSAQSDGSAHINELLRIEGSDFGGNITDTLPFRVLDESDNVTAFGLNNNTDIDMVTYYRINRFFVASNTAFDIYAEASNLVTTGDFTNMSYSNIRFTYVIFTASGNGWGLRAQNPSVGGQGKINSVNDLGDMASGPVKIFDGGRKTAASPGNIIQQAVSFIPIYYINEGGSGNTYDLSLGVGSIGAEVSYTIYTP